MMLDSVDQAMLNRKAEVGLDLVGCPSHHIA